MAHATPQYFWSPPPGALGRDQKVKYHKISITKSISKIFEPNFVCLLTNEIYKTHQTGFSFRSLGHALGVGLGGTVGVGGVKKLFSQIQPDLVCEYLHQWHIQRYIFWVPASWGLGEGPNGQISLNLNYKVNFKDF